MQLKLAFRPTLVLCAIVICALISCSKTTDLKQRVPLIQTTTIDIKNDSTAVTLSQAKEIAIAFLESKINNKQVATLESKIKNQQVTTPDSKIKNKQVTVKNAETIIRNNKTYFHIINASQGFVIVSPDSLYAPILAYDTVANFSFAEKDMNAGLILWMNKHALQLDFVRITKSKYADSIGKHNKLLWGGTASSSISQNPSQAIRQTTTGKAVKLNSPEPYPSLITSYDSYSTQIGPLLGALNWTQATPYNNFTPSVSPGDPNPFQSNGHYLAGSLPVAMAQVMHYWSWPASYSSQGTTYTPSWSSMALYDDASDPVQNYSINPQNFYDASVLISAIGRCQPSGYGETFARWATDGAGTYSIPDLAPWTFSIFGYDNVQMDGYSPSFHAPMFNGPPNDGFTGTMINSILAYKPCIVTGTTDYIWSGWFEWWNNGYPYAWVCDGLQQFYTRITYTYTYYTQESWGWLPHTEITQTGYYPSGTFLHFNWGMGLSGANAGPTNNGFYDISTNYTLAPNGKEYKYFQEVIYNIYH